MHTVRTSIFLATTTVVFALVSVILVALDAVPVPPDPEVDTVDEVATSTPAVPEVLPREVRSAVPVRISIPTIGVDTIVITPESTDIAVLDRALLSGAVHYPTSVGAGENGTMLLFGHSSYLPVVRNKAFQAFNELGKLKDGDQIIVESTTHAYTYHVEQVRLARAEDETIYFDASSPRLTLATCNTFGSKDERWIATATLHEVRPL